MNNMFRLNFEIQHMPLWFGPEICHAIYRYQDRLLGKRVIQHGLFPSNEPGHLAAYFLYHELREMVTEGLRVLQTDPDRVEKIHEEARVLNETLFSRAREIDRSDVREWSEKMLQQRFAELYGVLEESHGVSLPTTWFVDSDGEDFTTFLTDLVRRRVQNDEQHISRIFSVLTTPERSSMQAQEERESLAVLQMILQNAKACDHFRSSHPEHGIEKLESNVRNALEQHHQKWHWLPYTYMGPDYPFSHFLHQWSEMVRQDVDPQQELARLENGSTEILHEREDYLTRFSFTAEEKRLLDIAANIVWLKGFRKDALYYGCLAYDKIIKELGKRHDVSLNQMRVVSPYEMKDIATLDHHAINQRMKFTVVELRDGDVRIHVGTEAQTFYRAQRIEKVDYSNISELHGSCACTGHVTGIVKIVNSVEEMGKMQEGDIMVAHTTFPALVPAMKKAAAIVTDDGGLTCHAAIVARELQTPCVVGTKNATHVLRDGDRVEVDADHGIVKKS